MPAPQLVTVLRLGQLLFSSTVVLRTASSCPAGQNKGVKYTQLERHGKHIVVRSHDFASQWHWRTRRVVQVLPPTSCPFFSVQLQLLWICKILEKGSKIITTVLFFQYGSNETCLIQFRLTARVRGSESCRRAESVINFPPPPHSFPLSPPSHPIWCCL